MEENAEPKNFNVEQRCVMEHIAVIVAIVNTVIRSYYSESACSPMQPFQQCL